MPKVYLSEADREYAKCLRELNGSMKEKRITVAQIAQQIRKDSTTVSRKLRGQIPLTVMELIQINGVLKGEQ